MTQTPPADSSNPLENPDKNFEEVEADNDDLNLDDYESDDFDLDDYESNDLDDYDGDDLEEVLAGGADIDDLIRSGAVDTDYRREWELQLQAIDEMPPPDPNRSVGDYIF